MKYVIDNNIFSRSLISYLPFDVFDFIWQPLEKLIEDGIVISVSEVLCELEKRWETKKGIEWQWLMKNKSCFLKPSNEECKIVAEIFNYPKFRESVKAKSLFKGTPEADAFLVAKAKVIGGIIVTAEKDSPNSEKIPCIASKLKVPYIKEKDFYRLLKNIHERKNELKNIPIYYELGKKTVL